MSADMMTKARKIVREEFPGVFTVVKTGEEEYQVSWENHEMEMNFDGNAYDAMLHHTFDGLDFLITLTFAEDEETGEAIHFGYMVELKSGNDWKMIHRGAPEHVYFTNDDDELMG